MQVAIHKKKMYKRYKLPNLAGTIYFGGVEIIEMLKFEIDNDGGYELEQKHDFIGELIEIRNSEYVFEKGNHVIIDDKSQRIDEIVYTNDGILCIIDEIQAEEDEKTIASKKRSLDVINECINIAKVNREARDVKVEHKASEPIVKKSWWERIIG